MRRVLRRERGVSWLAVEEGQTMVAGLAAGAVMALVAMVFSVIGGESPVHPFRLAASVIVKDANVYDQPVWLAVPVGAAVHFSLSAIYGFWYGLLMTDEDGVHRGSRAFQAIIGMVLGLGLYLLNVQVIGRFWYPWFLASSQVVTAAIHVLGYGLPLGLFAAFADRRSSRHRIRNTRVTV
jgi:hypothetical protein